MSDSRAIANEMTKQGFRDAGYDSLGIDDCWLATERDENGRLQADRARFPSGIPTLAAYVHERCCLL